MARGLSRFAVSNSGRGSSVGDRPKLLDETLANAKASHASVGTLFNLRVERAALASGAERRQRLVAIQKEAEKLGYDATARQAAGLLVGR